MRRTTFAASVVITLAGCKHEPQMTHNPPPPDPDNGNTHNPPMPVAIDAPAATPDAAAAPTVVTRTWRLTKRPGAAPKKGEKAICDAYENVTCPPPVNGVMVSCNPPRPVQMRCPDQLAADGTATIQQTGDACTITPPCPPNAQCGEVAPVKTDCPTY